jgi:hypothetical protein
MDFLMYIFFSVQRYLYILEKSKTEKSLSPIGFANMKKFYIPRLLFSYGSYIWAVAITPGKTLYASSYSRVADPTGYYQLWSYELHTKQK